MSTIYTLNNALLNFIEHMKKRGGGQLDIRPPNLKIGGTCPPPHPPRINAAAWPEAIHMLPLVRILPVQ